jgi:16S rRNA (guanine527-N7)-methyltransferase
VRVLGLRDVEIIHGRAEDLGRNPMYREQYDWALARAVVEMPALAEYLLPLVRVGGAMLAQKGEGAAIEVQASDAATTAFGGKVRVLLPVELRGIAETRYLVVVDKVAATPDKYPRRPGMPKKRPIR